GHRTARPRRDARGMRARQDTGVAKAEVTAGDGFRGPRPKGGIAGAGGVKIEHVIDKAGLAAEPAVGRAVLLDVRGVSRAGARGPVVRRRVRIARDVFTRA